MVAFLQTIWQQITQFFTTYNWITDTLDILSVALFLYFIIRLVRDSRAEQLLRGILVLLLLYAVAYLVELKTIQYMLKAVFDNGLLLLIVVFQPEVRRALEQAGHSRGGIVRFFGGFNTVDNAAYIDQWNKAFEATADALETLQKEKMGALIVMERATKLGEIVRSGTTVDAEPSAALISAVFYNKAPLHDGAMIIRDGRVYATACILPLTDNTQISRELGTRHRAGVGMSEVTDAVIIIVSEETGVISVAVGGMLKRHLASQTLERLLRHELAPEKPEQENNALMRLVEKVLSGGKETGENEK